MKKTVLFIFAILISTGAGAVELWNGFTTEMNKDQVVAHAKTAISSSNFRESNSSSFQPFDIRSDRKHLNYQFPKMELYLYFDNPSAQYDSLLFYFSKGKLFGIEVRFKSATEDDFLPLAQKQYGKPTETFTETSAGIPNNAFATPFRRTWYVWTLPGRIVYTIGQTRQEYYTGKAILYICDRQAIDNFAKENADAEAQRKANATSGIKF